MEEVEFAYPDTYIPRYLATYLPTYMYPIHPSINATQPHPNPRKPEPTSAILAIARRRRRRRRRRRNGMYQIHIIEKTKPKRKGKVPACILRPASCVESQKTPLSLSLSLSLLRKK
jgi:hypothetical protein